MGETEMNEQAHQAFVQELMSIGILAYREQETLWDIAQRCSAKLGIPMAGVGAGVGAAVGGTVSIGTLTIPAALAGALIGLAAGTTKCVAINLYMRDELRKLATQASK